MISSEFSIVPIVSAHVGQAVILCAMVAVGCQGAGEGDTTEFVWADSSGVVVAFNPPPDAGIVPAWIMSPEPTVTIGLEDGEAPYVFSGVSGAAVLPTYGVIVVADRGSAELRYFGADGGHLKTVGGRGVGPGEFMQLYLAGRIGTDSVLAVDALQRRGVVYDASGRRIREFGFSPSFSRAAPSGILTKGRMVADPHFQSNVSPGNSDQISEGMYRPMREVKVADPAGELSLLIGPFPEREYFRYRNGSGLLLFGRSLHVSGRGDRIAVGNDDSYRVRVYDDSGTLLHIIAQVRTPVGIEDSDVEAGILDAISEYKMPEFRARMRAAMERMPRPSSFPAYASIYVDDDDRHVWVREFSRPRSANAIWQVFGPDGRLTGRVVSPQPMELLDVGVDYILGLVRTANQVETVQLHGLTRQVR